jgi:soluble lytic murein transglycosylase-like protein
MPPTPNISGIKTFLSSAAEVGKQSLYEAKPATLSFLKNVRSAFRPVRYVLDKWKIYPLLTQAEDMVSQYMKNVDSTMMPLTNGVRRSNKKVLEEMQDLIIDKNAITPTLNGAEKKFAGALDNQLQQFWSQYQKELGLNGDYQFFKEQTLNKFADAAGGIDPIFTVRNSIRSGVRNVAYNPVKENLATRSDLTPEIRTYTEDLLNYILTPQKAIGPVEKTARNAVNGLVNSVYSGTLSSPGAAITNLFQIPLGTSVEIGPRYTLMGMKEALKKIKDPQMIQALKDSRILDDIHPAELFTSIKGPKQAAVKKIEELAMWGFSTSEEFNRRVTFFGAYKQAMDKMSKLDLRTVTSDAADEIKTLLNNKDWRGAAQKYAKEIVAKTQYNYSIIDTPMVMRSPIGKAALMFWQFPMNTIEMLMLNMKTPPGIVKNLAYGANSALMYYFMKGMGIDISPKVGLTQLLPQNMSPIVQMFQSLGELANAEFVNKDGRKEQAAWNKLQKLLPLAVPGGALAKKLVDFTNRANDQWRIKSATGKTAQPTNLYNELVKLVFNVRTVDENERMERRFEKTERRNPTLTQRAEQGISDTVSNLFDKKLPVTPGPVSTATPGKTTPTKSTPSGNPTEALLDAAAAKYGIPPDILKAVAWQETGWNAKAVGDGGDSHGMMQINTPAHPDYDIKKGQSDPTYNIEYGARFLANLYKSTNDWQTAVTQYNGSGPKAVAYGNSVMNHVANTPWVRKKPALTTIEDKLFGTGGGIPQQPPTRTLEGEMFNNTPPVAPPRRVVPPERTSLEEELFGK